VIPIVEGLLLEDAQTEIFDSHLLPAVVEIGSLEPEGTVLSQEPIPGEEVPQGTAVTIRVSTGEPAQAPMVGLRGLSVDQVIEALRVFEDTTGVALSFNIQYVDTTNVDVADLVLFTTPDTWEIVTSDTVVTLYIGRLPGG
jgi:beta-lactam-binding protein with PASTA domain